MGFGPDECPKVSHGSPDLIVLQVLKPKALRVRERGLSRVFPEAPPRASRRACGDCLGETSVFVELGSADEVRDAFGCQMGVSSYAMC